MMQSMIRVLTFVLSICVTLIAPGHCFAIGPFQRTTTTENNGVRSLPKHSTTRTKPTVRPSPTQLSLVLGDIPSAYTYALSHYQLATESATSAFLAGVGDLVAQTVASQQDEKDFQFIDRKDIDWNRYQTFVIKGSLSGILWSNWYAFCDPFSLGIAQSLQSADSSNLQLLISILLEQFIWCPILYSLWDIPFPILLRGDDVTTIPTKVQSTIGGLLWENAKVWTFANLFVYNIPLQWRVVIVSLTDVVWQSILSSSIGETEEKAVMDSSSNQRKRPVVRAVTRRKRVTALEAERVEQQR